MLTALSRIGRRRALQGLRPRWSCSGCCCGGCCPSATRRRSGSVTFSTGVRDRGLPARTASAAQPRSRRICPTWSIRLQTSEGSQENSQRVATGKADFTIATADAVAHVPADGKPGAGRLRGVRPAVRRLRASSSLTPAPRCIRARDLRGKRVAVGPPGSGRAADRRSRAAGRRARPAEGHHRGAGRNRHRSGAAGSGKIDAFFWSGGLPTDAVRDLAARHPVRLVPLDDLVTRLHAGGGTTQYYRAAVIPGDAYRTARNGGPLPTVAVANVLVTTDRENPELTEGFTRSVIRSRDRIGAPGARGAAGGRTDGDLHRPAEAARGRPALLPLGQAVAGACDNAPSGVRGVRGTVTVTRSPCGSFVRVGQRAAARGEQGPRDGEPQPRAVDVLVAAAAPEAVADRGPAPRRSGPGRRRRPRPGGVAVAETRDGRRCSPSGVNFSALSITASSALDSATGSAQAVTAAAPTSASRTPLPSASGRQAATRSTAARRCR